MNKTPVIHVLAGPNGVGKTTLNYFAIPDGVTYINADDIARQLRERMGNINLQEIANAQAIEQMNKFIERKESFAIETNLADLETWKFLMGVQKLGYYLQLYFFCVDDIAICNNRITYRVLQGGHFVNPQTVKMRYDAGLKLLKQFKNIPNNLILIDNSTESIKCSELQQGNLVFQKDDLPNWIKNLFETYDTKKDEFLDIESVKEKYRQIKKDTEDKN